LAKNLDKKLVFRFLKNDIDKNDEEEKIINMVDLPE